MDWTVRFRGAGYPVPNLQTAYHYSWDASDSYIARQVPSIETISASGGYTTGQQQLVITGYSLDGSAVSVSVGGVDCPLSSITETELVCTTQETVLDGSASAPYLGQHGVHHVTVDNSAGGATSSNYQSYATLHDTIATTLETAERSVDENTFDIMYGYFEAPTSGNYQFHMSCDDSCSF